MTDLVTLVMRVAATEALQEEADQIDQEVQGLLVDMERASVGESRRFAQRFLVLLKRRGEVARKTLLLFKEQQSVRPRMPAPIKRTMVESLDSIV
jgi:hypothetical protein